MIGGVPDVRFVLPATPPADLFKTRAARLRFLAKDHQLAPYLLFLAELADRQSALCDDATAVAPVDPARQTFARECRMPPIDRAALADDPALSALLDALIAAMDGVEMPEPARLALRAVATATDEDRRWLLDNALAGEAPAEAAAAHLFVSAATEVYLARLTATLDPALLVPIRTGVCPACGGRPVASQVTGAQEIENLRYCSCGQCTTRWNEVRIKCLCCGSTKGISYRSVEDENATIKAEVCSECQSWVKIMYQVKNPSLDPVADDIGSLGLDLLMKDTGLRRAGYNPALMGY